MRTARAVGDPELIAAALNGSYVNHYRTVESLAERHRIASELLALATEHDLGTYRVLAHLELQQTNVALLDLPASHRHLAEGGGSPSSTGCRCSPRSPPGTSRWWAP